MARKVVHFEIPVDDGARAAAVYRQAFGWSLQQWGPVEYWLTEGGEGEGIGGALTQRSDDVPALMFYIEVDDLNAALADVEATGGVRVTDPMPIPTIGWSTFFTDTEGNKVGLFQADPTVPTPQAP